MYLYIVINFLQGKILKSVGKLRRFKHNMTVEDLRTPKVV